jgi:hypothetical protein
LEKQLLIFEIRKPSFEKNVLAIISLFFVFLLISQIIVFLSIPFGGLGFVGLMGLIIYKFHKWSSTKIFCEIGIIKLGIDAIIVEIQENKRIFNLKDISKIEFHYKGDYRWNSSYKSKTRYDFKRGDFISVIAYDRFDRIVINNEPFYVKIQNKVEKNVFDEILTSSKKAKLNVVEEFSRF